MTEAAASGSVKRTALGRAVIPVRFGEQVIVSILYNHDANPVHHRPDHALQWMLGLLAAQGVGGNEEFLAHASPEERTYSLGTRLLAHEDMVVMPGVALASICYERFVEPTEITASLSATFTYPLLVPTRGAVEVIVEAYEVPDPNAPAGARSIQIEAFGPSVTGTPTRLMKHDALVFKAGTDRNDVYEQVVKPQFQELGGATQKVSGLPALSHPSSISSEDRRRYSRIVDPGATVKARPITEAAWQCKIPRVLTEVIDYLANNEPYQNELKKFHSGRAEDVARVEAITRYVEKELKYHWITDDEKAARIEHLASLQQHLYARQHTVFDPRSFVPGGAATLAGTQITLDLQLSEMRLRRNLHRFSSNGRLKGDTVFMGEATLTAQPLITRELANFLCEINHSFETMKLLEYKR